MNEIQDEAESLARHLIGAVRASVTELRLHGRETACVRLHPLDAECIVVGLFPDADLSAIHHLTLLGGLPTRLDEDARLGEPVAEFAP